ncbi:MAG: ParB N-terminal domain-containing protein, partial [Bacteroidota bacterium]|nr:ParB N-terminal domain-containing protein [Bacteroidota bacterium]
MSQFAPVLISLLDLDPENPRLPEKLKTKDTTESDVLNWMLEDATLVDLIASIAENGFFPGEPIIVIEGLKKGRYTVVEGNRRLAALKLLQDPTIAEVSNATVSKLSELAWKKKHVPLDVSVYVAPDRDSVDNYLGFRHVTGVKQWPTISKARYLYRLFKKKEYYDGIFKELAREIGSKG